MATGISEKMGGPHTEDSSLWSPIDPPTSSHLCPFCNKSHNSRDTFNFITGWFWCVQYVAYVDQITGELSKHIS